MATNTFKQRVIISNPQKRKLEEMTATRYIQVTEGTTVEIQTSVGTLYVKNKQLHNTDGPAVINRMNNLVAYYIEGTEVKLPEWLKYCTLSDEDKALMLFTME